MRDDSAQTFTISSIHPGLLAVSMFAVFALIAVIIGATARRVGISAWADLDWFVVSGIALIPIVLITPMLKWHVGPSGVDGPDNHFIRRHIAWGGITSVYPMPIPGYRFVWVHATSKRKALWLPLFFTDMVGFRAAVARHAEPGNPLRRYLEGGISPVM
jgi:hypothetical protein